jgi:uncharacterized protein YcbX
VEVGTVRALARYPVKSTAGESLGAAVLDARGLRGDRVWAVYTDDGGIASGKTTRRFRRVDGLLGWRSTLDDDSGVPVLHDPDGQRWSVDDPAAACALTGALGRGLRPGPEADVSHFDDSGVHLLSTASLRATGALVAGEVDPRRFRANLVIDTDDTDAERAGFVEDGWTGELALGPEVVLRLGEGMVRCRMVDLPQAYVPVGPAVLRALGRAHDTVLGRQAEVLRTGTVRVGDRVRLLG